MKTDDREPFWYSESPQTKFSPPFVDRSIWLPRKDLRLRQERPCPGACETLALALLWLCSSLWDEESTEWDHLVFGGPCPHSAPHSRYQGFWIDCPNGSKPASGVSGVPCLGPDKQQCCVPSGLPKMQSLVEKGKWLGLGVHGHEHKTPRDGLCSETGGRRRRGPVGEGPGPRLILQVLPRMALRQVEEISS